MIRTRFVLSLCILSLFILSAPAQAAIIIAKSCAQSDVAAAVASASNGDTVTIPSGACTWTTSLTISKGITLQGAGQTLTVITASGTDLLFISGSGSAFRLTGVGFTGNNSFGAIQIEGHFSTLRLDHLQFTNMGNRSIVIGYSTWPTPTTAIQGLADHITYTNNACRPFTLQYGNDMEAWTNDDNWGTIKAFYLEDSTLTWNVSSTTIASDCTAWDQEHGARAVIRHNTITNGTIQGHDTGSTQQSRGLRIKEIYSNTFKCALTSGVDCGFTAMDFRGGSYLVYDNQFPIVSGSTPGYENANATEIWRLTGSPGTSDPWNFKCSASEGTSSTSVASDFRSHCSGTPYPACGSQESVNQACMPQTCGGGSCGTCIDNPSLVPSGITVLKGIDGNGSGGYPCRDQVGRGKDSVDHTTQALTPIYWWNNTDPNSGGSQLTALNVASGEISYIQLNREVYMFSATFNGTSAVGRGLLSARPATCTPTVAYFATDTTTLYQCSLQNTWTTYYTPFTYPHPLQAGAVPPAPPPGVRAVVN